MISEYADLMDAEEPRDLRVEFQSPGSCDISICNFLHARELGKRSSKKIKLLTPVSSLGRVRFEKWNNNTGLEVLDTKVVHKSQHRGGWLGFTFNGNMLVGFSTLRDYVVVQLFLNTLNSLRMVREFDLRNVYPTTSCKVFFPPKPSFCGIMCLEREDTERRGRELPSVPGVVHLYSLSSDVHIEYTFPFACVRRTNKLTKQILPKQFMHVVSHGVIINSGLNLIALLLLPAGSTPPSSNLKTDIAGHIIQQPYYGSKNYKTPIKLNDGEVLTVRCQTRRGYKPSSVVRFVKSGEEEVLTRGKWTHSLYLKSYNLQDMFVNLLMLRFKSSTKFHGSILHGITDYEVNVIGIEGDLVELQAEVLAEILLDGNTNFYMFGVYLKWNPLGSLFGQVIDSKITSAKEVFGSTWYPWNELPQMEANTVFSHYLDNDLLRFGSRKQCILEAGYDSGCYYVFNNEDEDCPGTFKLIHSIPLVKRCTRIAPLVDRLGQPLAELGAIDSAADEADEYGYDYDSESTD